MLSCISFQGRAAGDVSIRIFKQLSLLPGPCFFLLSILFPLFPWVPIMEIEEKDLKQQRGRRWKSSLFRRDSILCFTGPGVYSLCAAGTELGNLPVLEGNLLTEHLQPCPKFNDGHFCRVFCRAEYSRQPCLCLNACIWVWGGLQTQSCLEITVPQGPALITESSNHRSI